MRLWAKQAASAQLAGRSLQLSLRRTCAQVCDSLLQSYVASAVNSQGQHGSGRCGACITCLCRAAVHQLGGWRSQPAGLGPGQVAKRTQFRCWASWSRQTNLWSGCGQLRALWANSVCCASQQAHLQQASGQARARGAEQGGGEHAVRHLPGPRGGAVLRGRPRAHLPPVRRGQTLG